MLPKFSPCFPSGKIDDQIPCFPRVMATLSLVSKKVAIGLTVIFTLQIVMLNMQENYVHPNCGFK